MVVMSVWLSAHPHHDNALWGRRAIGWFVALCILVLGELAGLALVLYRVSKRRRQLRLGLCRRCEYPIGPDRCSECGRLASGKDPA